MHSRATTSEVHLIFDPELRFFLPKANDSGELKVRVEQNRSIKDLVESIGVPHVEIGQLIVKNASVNFDYTVLGGEMIYVHAPSIPIDLTRPSFLRKQTVHEIKFLADVHLGKLKDFLRLLGLDTIYHNPIDDKELARLAFSENRILLTRDRNLLKRKNIQFGYCLRSTQPKCQLDEILHRFKLNDFIHPFSRCIACNAPLVRVPKEQIIYRIPPRAAQYYDNFCNCSGCGRIYWQGSHYKELEGFVREVLRKNTESACGVIEG